VSSGPAGGDLPDSGYEVVEHTADWALRIYGDDMKALLLNAARGMTALMVSEPEAIALDEQRRLELEAMDAETLLVDWLSELAYWAESEGLVFRQFDLSQVCERHMSATLTGGHADELLKHIKAVTYHDLEIVRTARGLTATVVFDV
jgi:SHS2 domain-containing protein